MSVVGDALRWRARQCARMGSPLYGHLLAAAAEDAEAGGPVADVLAAVAPPEADVEWLQDTGMPLRLVGSVHRLVLAGELPDLARHYPSARIAVPDGPDLPERDDVGFPPAHPPVDAAAAWRAFRAALESHRAAVVTGLARPPQTNEVGRAAVLIGGLLHLGARTGLPVRLWELGTSAGLNLRADRFRLRLGDSRGVGPRDSPVVLDRPWVAETAAAWPPVGPIPRVVERRGCDPDPIDVRRPEEVLRLQAYVWPDQPDRHRALAGAIALAHRIPAEIVPTGAGAFLEELAPERGALTLVWHSVTRKYVADEEWGEVRGHLRRAAADASSEAPLARLALEPRRREAGARPFLASLTLWPPGDRRVLARAHAHGSWVRWHRPGGPDSAGDGTTW